MTIDMHQHNKQFINQFRNVLYDCDLTQMNDQLNEIFAPDLESGVDLLVRLPSMNKI